jgi:hypothetical protein
MTEIGLSVEALAFSLKQSLKQDDVPQKTASLVPGEVDTKVPPTQIKKLLPHLARRSVSDRSRCLL